MECPQIDLYEFLTDSELQQYYNVIKNELKITNAAQFKYATDEDLKHIGLSRPEIRRLRKYYEKHFPHGYLSKIKRLLQAPATMVKREDGSSMLYSNSSLNSYGGSESSTTTAAASTAGSPNKAPNNKHIIPADSISVNKQLGTGEFGIVQQGVWTNGTERIQVAIKCLCRERMQSNPMEFLKEAAIMHSIEHENIVRLYGVVLATDSLMLVTELAHLRSLLECLKDSGLRVSFLTVPTLCEFATQICNGMSYLENKRLIHRDLAARNILVFSKNKVKISDFGLSRALGVGKDYYKTNFNVNLKLPIAWCAPECINYLRFTNASDVWAFGVCLWEMFSYGFQPWAALTGLQILEAIDTPNYQRLEQPDCCPTEYYTLMMKCWQDDPLKRPKFSEIAELLPEMKPEQLKAVVNSLDTKNDQLSYRQGDIITVLDRNTGTPFWKGVLNTGKTGYFNPSNTVAYLEGLPSASRESFGRINERSSKRKLRTEMISKPQNDLKHTGHIGIDGASFGDIAFLGNSQSYNHVPRQIVTPYKPSEDIEQTPLLLPPTPTSPDSMQSCYFNEGNQASGTSVNPSFVSSTENTPRQTSSFQFPHYSVSSNNPFAQKSNEELHNSSGGLFALQNKNYGMDRKCFTNNSISLLGEMDNETNEMNWRNAASNRAAGAGGGEEPHEYHEISDDEMTAEKLDLGPSLLEEINSMFGSMSASSTQPTDFEQINIKNEFAEITSKLGRKNSGGDSSKFGHSKKKNSTGQVKPISVKDEKILNQAIEIANEISARSMNDLVSDQPPQTQSPKRKFSFRFPHLTKDGSKTENLNNHATSAHGSEHNGAAGTAASPHTKKKNFSEELKSIPDLQRFRSLSEIKGFNRYDNNLRIPLFDKESSDFCFEKSRELLSRPLKLETPLVPVANQALNDNISDIEKTLKALNLDFMQNYNEFKTDSNETILNERFSSFGPLEDDMGSGTAFNFNAATNHLDKQLQLMETAAMFAAPQEQKAQEDKRSSTPDTGFASRDTNMSLSRRSSQKSSYSPQDNYFNFPTLTNTLKEERLSLSKQAHSPLKVMTNTKELIRQTNFEQLNTNQEPRERSMSFNDKFNCISPVLSEPQQRHLARNNQMSKHMPARRASSYKPRSVRARTLRRLSYNPLMLASSSSSSSSGEDSESNCSLARSECDIRSRVSHIYRHRKQRQCKQEEDAQASNKELLPHKLYGSNVSIKSAPHYNFAGRTHTTPTGGMRHYVHKFEYEQCTNYEFGMPNAIFSQVAGGVLPTSSGSSSTSAASNAAKTAAHLSDLMQEFDVSRLTGKSPTSSHFVGTSPPERSNRLHVSPPKSLPLLSTTSQPLEFQWPEKIHASTVKQNEIFWRNRLPMPGGRHTSSSENVEFELREDFAPRIPPSPAP